ncbi:hypothetical protein [Dictyobacter formicarum]|uniref:Uncharacterized protein n=1 Tax=Dictyobacter formicarum TaxID=2778368 RepID=A0ABQ3VLS2_9CHLR|nr:hypothetical protein [Dictyobacter formicarum]GHO86634.1 hypothetical protein KSZ_46400 [Dictyobacter formicarum]
MVESLPAPLLELVRLANEGNKKAIQAIENIARDILDQDDQRFYRVCEKVAPVLLRMEVRKIMESQPRYLPLPPQLSQFERDPVFLAARPVGRFWYRFDMHSLDEEGLEVVRAPRRFSRHAIFQYLDSTVRIPDVELHLEVPLSYRVGELVGWLSALATSQHDDAQAGIVMLSALVAPLLVSAPVPPTAPAGRLRAGRK